MSMSFSIANPKLFFVPKRVLSVDECLAMVDDLIQTNLDELNPTDEGMQDFYGRSLDELECLKLAKASKMGRGFELRFYEEAYHVCVQTPATVFDWEQALLLLQALSYRLGRPVIGEYGGVFGADEIVEFDYRSDILAGIRACQQSLDEGAKFCQISGLMHPMAFDKAMIAHILSSENPAETFSELFTDNQAIEAYFASPMLTQKDGKTFGNYVLSENLPTILPHMPSLESEGLESGDLIDEWFVHFDTPERGEHHWRLPHDEFISKLTLHDYERLDAKYALIYSMSASRFLDLLGQTVD